MGDSRFPRPGSVGLLCVLHTGGPAAVDFVDIAAAKGQPRHRLGAGAGNCGFIWVPDGLSPHFLHILY